MPNLPERSAISDALRCALVGYAGAIAITDADFDSEGVVYRGDVFVRYGLQYLGKPQYCLVPDLVVLDYGEGFAGEEAWDFLLHRSNLYPRADVFGFRNDGVDDMTVVKKLDLAIPPDLLLYTEADIRLPVGRTRAFIGKNTNHLPQRLRLYCQVYEHVEAWRADIDKYGLMG